jgi:hypothetical protein
MVAIISRFARSIRSAYRDNSIGSWDRRAPRRRSSAYHLRRSARVSIVSCGTAMNATERGAVSEYAARSVLAANWQGKFLVAHNAPISAPQDLDETSQVDSILKGAGVALKRLADDRELHSVEIDATLARNAAEARDLGLRGTPGFLIGRQLVPRSLTLQQLRQLTANARAAPWPRAPKGD